MQQQQQQQQQQQPLSAIPQQLAPGVVRSRARAGTLPSRLPLGVIQPSPSFPSLSNASTPPPLLSSASPPPPHALSLESSQPASSPFLAGTPSSSSSDSLHHIPASGQTVPTNSSQIYNNPRGAAVVTSSSPLARHPSQFAQNSSTSSLPSNDHFDPYRTEIPFTTPSSSAPHSSSSSGSSSTTSSASSSASSASSTSSTKISASRLRSGSLNILSDRSHICPSLISSIWSQPRGSSLLSEANRPSQSSPFDEQQNSPQQQNQPSSQPTRQQSPSRPIDQQQQQQQQQQRSPQQQPQEPIDPLQPFYKSLTMRTDPSRMRSYTVNTLPYGLVPFDSSSSSSSSSNTTTTTTTTSSSSITSHEDLTQQPQQAQQYSQPTTTATTPLNHIPTGTDIPATSPTRHATFITGNRPRAQTTASAFDPPLSIGNVPLIRLSMSQQHQQHQQTHHQQQQHLLYHDNDFIFNLPVDEVGPTRSLWLGNIPASTTSYALQAIFSSYGTVESARVLPHKNCGFVNFVNTESAVQAKEVLNGKELFSGTGPCRVSFTKVVDLQSIGYDLDSPESSTTPLSTQQSSQAINQQQSSHQQPSSPLQNHSPSAKDEIIEYSVTDKDSSTDTSLLDPPKSLEEIADDLVTTVADLGADPTEQAQISASVKRALSFKTFYSDIGTVPDPRPDRVYDAPTLREVRKKIDSGTCSTEEIEDIALDILDEIAELSSDYVGNTVVQKLFDLCSEPIKDMMLKKISPYMSQISIHKNGTWAAQKIISVAGTSRQINMITEALHPYTVHLFLDQFGNYAIQCVLKFGSPWNDFIFETMLSKFWEIAQGRFGARAMRACLESHYVSKEQQRMIASAITMHAVQLATNANGALLLTWFLDTYTVPNRHTILAPRLIPHLVQLGTHKLASLTVLKVVNYRSEPGARQAIFDTLFNPSEEAPSPVLEQILNHSYGPTFIFKIVSTPLLEGAERQNAINKIRQVLIAIKALPAQGYKRLMDEVGLSTRTTPLMGNGPSSNSNNGRSMMNGNGNNNTMNPSNNNSSRGYYQMRNSNQRQQRMGGGGGPHMMHQQQHYFNSPLMTMQRGDQPQLSSPNGFISQGDMVYQYGQYQQAPPHGPPPPQMLGMGAVSPNSPYDLALLQQQFDSMGLGAGNGGMPNATATGAAPNNENGSINAGAPYAGYLINVNGMLAAGAGPTLGMSQAHNGMHMPNINVSAGGAPGGYYQQQQRPQQQQQVVMGMLSQQQQGQLRQQNLAQHQRMQSMGYTGYSTR